MTNIAGLPDRQLRADYASARTGSSNFRRSADDLTVNTSTYEFTGLKGQFAEIPQWNSPSTNSDAPKFSLAFQFRTRRENALLAYSDDGGNLSFIAITLHKRALKVQFKFGRARSVSLTLGLNLNDGVWHTVLVERKYPEVMVTVDDSSKKGSIDAGEGTDLIPESPTYIGGFPENVSITKLALPSLYFERKFAGWMRQITMNEQHVQLGPAMKEVLEVYGECPSTR